MATFLVLGLFFLVRLSFTEKPTYEQILIRAKSGNLPEVVDRSDTVQTPVGMYLIFKLSYIGMLIVNYLHFPFCHLFGISFL